MGAASYYRGHKIEYINNEWVYSDTKKLVSENKNRACGKCGKSETKEGHDACLGILPGFMNACCGHGVDEPYIQFLDETCIRGNDAKIIIDILKKYSGGNHVNLKNANCAIFVIASALLIKPKISFTNTLTKNYRNNKNLKADFYEAEYWMIQGYDMAIKRLKKHSL